MANNAVGNLDLFRAFDTYADANQFFKSLKEFLVNADPTITFLTLEGMYRIENEVKSHQLEGTLVGHDVWSYNLMQSMYDNLNQARYQLANAFTFHYAGEREFLDPPQQLENPGIDLLGSFIFDDKRNTMFESLLAASRADPLIAVLALQGLHCIENDFNGPRGLRLDDCPFTEQFRDILVEWRRNMQCDYGARWYGRKLIPDILRPLTIFTVLEVPLFIDDYGKKVPLAKYSDTVAINIDGNTPIFHVTHAEQAEQIMEEDKIQSSNNKNSIEGVWFGIQNNPSVYGSRSFGTTLNQLGITGLRQGEIVTYTNEINVILYATDDDGTDFGNLVKPSEEAERIRNPKAYVPVSIFVPERFMHDYSVNDAVHEDVVHAPHCVKKRRDSNFECTHF